MTIQEAIHKSKFIYRVCSDWVGRVRAKEAIRFTVYGSSYELIPYWHSKETGKWRNTGDRVTFTEDDILAEDWESCE